MSTKLERKADLALFSKYVTRFFNTLNRLKSATDFEVLHLLSAALCSLLASRISSVYNGILGLAVTTLVLIGGLRSRKVDSVVLPYYPCIMRTLIFGTFFFEKSLY